MAGLPTLRTRVYIDGYNLYYGCLKGTPYKWLDIVDLFENKILPSSTPESIGVSQLLPLAIKFFTARIIARVAESNDSVSSQDSYHSALRKLYPEKVEIIEGFYSLTCATAKSIDPSNEDAWPRDCVPVTVWKVEEKQTDVNLALQAYHDAINNLVDQVIIVTNDTDIAPALKLIRDHTSVKIGLVIPTKPNERRPNTDLAKHANWVRTHITQDELSNSQLPRVIPGRRPSIKPESWYAEPELLKKILDISTKKNKSETFKWMEQESSYLDNKKPIDLIETADGALQVINYMNEYNNSQNKDLQKNTVQL